MKLIFNDKVAAAKSQLKKDLLKKVFTAKDAGLETVKLDLNKDEAAHIESIYQEVILTGFIASKSANSITVDFLATEEADKSPFEFED